MIHKPFEKSTTSNKLQNITFSLMNRGSEGEICKEIKKKRKKERKKEREIDRERE